MEERIAIFASGRGSNAEHIIRHFQDNEDAGVSLLLSNKANSGAIYVAKQFGVQTFTFTKEQLTNGQVLNVLKQYSIDLIALAGFLWLVPESILNAYPDRVVNIHPALLPRFGGKGMYGINVHKAVIEAGEKETGITVHKVNEQYDKGAILHQATCAVMETDTPEALAARVKELEHEHYPKVIETLLAT